MKTVYLDNSATTFLSERVKNKIISAMEVYGNPSSLHTLGVEAQTLIDEARENVGYSLGVRGIKRDQLIFTSCGSEATALALLGCAHAKKFRPGSRIITTDSEHPSVEKNLLQLEKEGFEIVKIPTRGGVLDMEAYRRALDGNVFMVTMMLVNNETGALYDIQAAFSEAKRKNPDIITHCDAVQGYLKYRFTPKTLCADLISISGHKVHAPKGVGALYVDPAILKARKLSPFLFGGGQESGYRSGTENTIGISAFGEAAKEGFERFFDNIETMTELRRYAEGKLSELDIKLNIPLGERAPHIINLTLPDIKSETMLHYLSKDGIFVSSGSACSSNSAHRQSEALIAFGLDGRAADCSLRVSLCEYNTKEDIDALASSLEAGIRTLVKIH